MLPAVPEDAWRGTSHSGMHSVKRKVCSITRRYYMRIGMLAMMIMAGVTPQWDRMHPECIGETSSLVYNG